VKFRCEACRGRGWLPASTAEWSDPCKTCRGQGHFTLASLGKKLDEDPRVLENVYEVRCQYRTARRVFRKLMEMMQW
jgi:hypothetical protein